MDEETVRKLHGLYQVIEPPHDRLSDRALVCLSQLHRKPTSKRATTSDAGGASAPRGELEWIVGLAGPGKAGPDAKGKKRVPDDEWWESRLSMNEIADWLEEGKAAHETVASLLGRLRLAWENGELHVKGYAGPGTDPRMGLELEARLDDSATLSLVLSPCSVPPMSLEQVLVETIPAFNRVKASVTRADRAAGAAPAIDYKEQYEKLLQRADKLTTDKKRLESEVAVLREQNKRARKLAKRANSGEGSGAQGLNGSPSPTKPAVPGGARPWSSQRSASITEFSAFSASQKRTARCSARAI
ncbi:hypothetical protein JCM3774_004499 [Rhodotorula dairenensis]